MPAYNEEDLIESTLTELSEHLDSCGFDYEIVVVNDGSQDGTGRVLAEVTKRLPRVRSIDNPGPGGYGFAIRKGLEVYRGDAMVIVTSDGADSPKDVAAYFRKIEEGYDCAFGSRFGPSSTIEGYPPVKRAINRIANKILALVLRQKYDDFTNGFKCYRRHVIDEMQPLITGQFNITIELVLKAVLGGWRYAVIPNDWKQRETGESNFNALRLIKPYAMTMFYCLARNYLLRVRR